MSDVTISYKGGAIATMDDSGTKTLMTEGKYCEDDIEVGYVKPAAPTGTKQISITENGTTTEDVSAYASAQIVANVPNSYAAADEGKVVSNGALVSQTSDTVTQNGTVDTTLINSLTVNVSGGTAITDGIVIKARNANGYPTEIDFYGDTVSEYMFGQGSNNTVGWMYLARVNYKTTCKKIDGSAFAFSGKNSNSPAPIPEDIETIGARAFYSAHYISATFPVTYTERLPDSLFTYSQDLLAVYAPGITSLATSGGNGNGQFYNCTGLQTCEIGSVGHGITDSRTWCFRNCAQSGLTITLYTTGAYTDTLVSNIRSSATNATIVIKASESTTYNGTNYAAGDTILTSEVV